MNLAMADIHCERWCEAMDKLSSISEHGVFVRGRFGGGPSWLVCAFVGVVVYVTQRKQHKPGIAKNDKNNGTIKTTNKPIKPHPNSQRTTLQTCAPNIRRTTHISQHSTPINTQVTVHQRSIPQATHAHPRPSQSAHNNTAPILHTPVQARQALNNHDLACTQHRRHTEHSQKACMVQKANEQGTPPLYREGTAAARRPGERGGGVVAGGGPQNTSKGAQRGRR